MTNARDAAYTKPLPRLTPQNEPYWQALKNHELRLPKCNACGVFWHPPASSVCPNCLTADDFEFTKLSGRGKIWAWLRMHQPYFKGFEAPYNIIYVELEEQPGLRMMSNLVEYDDEQLRCDQPVEVVFDDVTTEWTLAKFRPSKA